MEALSALFVLIITSSLFAALGLASNIWGADSRPSIGDDHAR